MVIYIKSQLRRLANMNKNQALSRFNRLNQEISLYENKGITVPQTKNFANIKDLEKGNFVKCANGMFYLVQNIKLHEYRINSPYKNPFMFEIFLINNIDEKVCDYYNVLGESSYPRAHGSPNLLPHETYDIIEIIKPELEKEYNQSVKEKTIETPIKQLTNNKPLLLSSNNSNIVDVEVINSKE